MPTSAKALRAALFVAMLTFFYRLGEHTEHVLIDEHDIPEDMRLDVRGALWVFRDVLPVKILYVL